MRTTRGAVAVAVLSVAGLLVSLGAALPPLTHDAVGDAGKTAAGRPQGGASPDSEGASPAFTGPPALAPAAPAAGQVRRRDASSVPFGPAGAPPPTRLVMDGVGLSLPVRAVGVAADGQMSLPADPSVLGWYRFGPAPGEGASGSAVLAGHLDSRRFGLGPLVRLRDVQVGDPVRVTASDGTVTSYTVVGVRRYDRTALPPVLFSRSGPPRLRIITCGGSYDEERGYAQNLVVTASPR